MRRRRLRVLLCFARPALASALVLAVLAGAMLAGRHYVYCTAMQQVMSHSCCERAERQPRPEQPALAEIAVECCQARATASASVFVPVVRDHELTIPFVATLPRAPLLFSALADARVANRDPAMRTGPPLSRALALLMVFRI